MKVGELRKILKECDNNTEVIIFAETEDKKYRPFTNIYPSVMNKGSVIEKLIFDVSIYTEYKNLHFPDNPSEEEVEDLTERRTMLLEELEEINNELKGFVERNI